MQSQQQRMVRPHQLQLWIEVYAEVNNLFDALVATLTVTVQFRLVCFDDPTHNVRLLFVHLRRKFFCLLLVNRLYVIN